jgi:hypothetical protein
MRGVMEMVVESGDVWFVVAGPDVRCAAVEGHLGRGCAVSPRLLEVRRSSRRTRSRCRSLVAQFPGYLFVRSSQLETVQHERWGLRPLTLGGAQATVTEEQVSHALALEARSRLSALPRGRARTLVPGDRVVLVDGPLLLDPHAPPLGVVTEVRDRHLVVLLDGATLPVLCAHDAVSPE